MKLIVYFFSLVGMACFGYGCQSSDNKNEELREQALPEDTASTVIIGNSNMAWEGTWEREGNIDQANLTISAITSSSFDFHFSGYDGVSTGEFTGTASLESDMALYINVVEKDTCLLNFLLQDSLIKVTQMNKICTQIAGLDFSGEYFDDRYFKEKVMEEEAEEALNP